MEFFVFDNKFFGFFDYLIEKWLVFESVLCEFLKFLDVFYNFFMGVLLWKLSLCLEFMEIYFELNYFVGGVLCEYVEFKNLEMLYL